MLNRSINKLARLFVLGAALFGSAWMVIACTGAATLETAVATQATFTPGVTVFVTQVVATPLPETPLPPATNTPLPTTKPYDPFDPFSVHIYYPITGCSASRLHVDDKAFVAVLGEKAKLYFSTDVLYDPGSRALQLDEVLLILDGPACSDGYLLWWVETEADELKGWAPEGDGETYWLLPLLK